MSEEKPSMFKGLVDSLEKEVIPGAKQGYEELGEAAKDLVPHLRGGWGKVVGYGKKLGEQVKGGVEDAKHVASELTHRKKKGEEEEEIEIEKVDKED